jgi:hypothetical protein
VRPRMSHGIALFLRKCSSQRVNSKTTKSYWSTTDSIRTGVRHGRLGTLSTIQTRRAGDGASIDSEVHGRGGGSRSGGGIRYHVGNRMRRTVPVLKAIMWLPNLDGRASVQGGMHCRCCAYYLPPHHSLACAALLDRTLICGLVSAKTYGRARIQGGMRCRCCAYYLCPKIVCTTILVTREPGCPAQPRSRRVSRICF